MKTVIWILFFVVALVCTGVAWVAAEMAGWLSNTIATANVAQATGAVSNAAMTAIAAATAAAPALPSIPAVPAIPAIPALPALPPVPELPAWAGALMTPELTAWWKETTTWAQGLAQQSAVAANAASTTGQNAVQAASAAAAAAATSAATDVANSVRVTDLGGAVSNAASTAQPWFAKMASWLVPIVWVIWAIVMAVLLLGTFALQFLVRLFAGGGKTPPPAASTALM